MFFIRSFKPLPVIDEGQVIVRGKNLLSTTAFMLISKVALDVEVDELTEEVLAAGVVKLTGILAGVAEAEVTGLAASAQGETGIG